MKDIILTDLSASTHSFARFSLLHLNQENWRIKGSEKAAHEGSVHG